MPVGNARVTRRRARRRRGSSARRAPRPPRTARSSRARIRGGGRTRNRPRHPPPGEGRAPDRREALKDSLTVAGHGKRGRLRALRLPFPVSRFPFPAPRFAMPLTPPPRTSLSARRSQRPTASQSLDQTRFPSGHEAPPHGGTGRRPDPLLRRPLPLPPDREGVLSGSPAAHRP